VARHKIRDIRSAHQRSRAAVDSTVVDLKAWAGRNIIRFPRTSGPASAA
jgi:hypothetical protein